MRRWFTTDILKGSFSLTSTAVSDLHAAIATTSLLHHDKLLNDLKTHQNYFWWQGFLWFMMLAKLYMTFSHDLVLFSPQPMAHFWAESASNLTNLSRCLSTRLCRSARPRECTRWERSHKRRAAQLQTVKEWRMRNWKDCSAFQRKRRSLRCVWVNETCSRLVIMSRKWL